MVKNKFKISFESNVHAVKDIVALALQFISENTPISSEELFDIRLIFCELLFNAIIHGNKQDITKKVYISVQVEDNVINASVSDEGLGFNYFSILENIDSDDIYKETGRGIKLVYSLTDVMSFENNGSTIAFSKKVTSHG